VNVSRESGPLFSRPFSGRGLALGDFDNDGAVDVLISTNDGVPILMKNNVGSKNHWLGVSLAGKTCNRDAIGANHMAGWRSETEHDEDRRRQLSLLPRSTNGSGHRR
jgi:hypothetical protein